VKEFAVPPPGQRLRFYAEADKAVNQKTAPFVPCGWGSSIFSALGDCVRLIRQFPYEVEQGGEERAAGQSPTPSRTPSTTPSTNPSTK
jgi:hypothetical protein